MMGGSELSFICTLDRDTFNLVLTKFFNSLGYVESNVELYFNQIDFEDDRVNMQATVREETLQ